MSKTNLHTTDTLIIGSGFGGAVTAATLCRHSLDVTLLERGPWRDSVPVASMGVESRSPYPRQRHFYTHFLRNVEANLSERVSLPNLRLNRNGLYELFWDRQLLIACCSGVGGGSLGYSGLHHPPADPRYWHGVGDAIDPATMTAYYEEFLQQMGSTRPDPAWQIPNHTVHMHRNNPLIGGDVANWWPWMGLKFRTGNRDDSNVQRLPSNYRNEGLLGAYSGSKASLDFTYLEQAINDGLQLRDCTEAMLIRPLPAHSGYRYAVTGYDHRRNVAVEYRTRQLFLGAGTLNTLRLLLRSRASTSGLQGMPLLGRGFATNADSIALWLRKDLGLDFSEGMSCHGTLAFRDGQDQAQFIQAGISGLDEIPMPELIRRQLRSWLFVTAMGEDRNDGVAYWRNGRLRIRYSTRDSQLHQHIFARFRQLRDHFGKPLLFSEKVAATLHPLGGVPIHDDPQRGVINSQGELHDHPGLFVVDASALPKAPGMPPSMTVSAWSRHVAQQFLLAQATRPATLTPSHRTDIFSVRHKELS